MIAGSLLLALALSYAIWVSQRLDWVLAISGPVALIGVLLLGRRGPNEPLEKETGTAS